MSDNVPSKVLRGLYQQLSAMRPGALQIAHAINISHVPGVLDGVYSGMLKEHTGYL